MTVTVSLRETPEIPLEADSITPTHFAGKTAKEIGELPLQQGNQVIQLKAGRCFVREGVADSQPPAVGAGRCRSPVTQGYRAPGRPRYLPEFQGQMATFDWLSAGREETTRDHPH